MAKITLFILFLYLRSFGAPVPEKDCTYLDLTKDLPPPRTQGSEAGWCYAFTAADLLSFKYKKNISPIDIALSYNEMKDQIVTNRRQLAPDPLNSQALQSSGYTDYAIEALKLKGGYCKEEKMTGLSSINTPSNYFELLQSIESLKQKHEASKKDNLPCTISKSQIDLIPLKAIIDILDKSTQDSVVY